MSDLGRQRFLVKSLISGKEKRVHADHTKIVPETCCTPSMNRHVRTPFPGIHEEQGSEKSSDQSEEELIVIPPKTGADVGSAHQQERDSSTEDVEATTDVDDHHRPDEDLPQGGDRDPVQEDDNPPPTETGLLTHRDEVRSGHGGDEPRGRRYNLRQRKKVDYKT